MLLGLGIGEDDTPDEHEVEPTDDAVIDPPADPAGTPPGPPFWGPWRDDMLPGYQCRDYVMPAAERYHGEPSSPLRATLVRRNRPQHSRAVLYVHGWNDYFFQTHLADFWDSRGYDFYALDLRRYGRSMDEGDLPGYIEDLADYDLELDAAVERIRKHHGRVVVTGHSTGGLIVSLWTSRHPGAVAGLVLNSPWIELQGSAVMRALGASLVRGLATRAPTWPVPMVDNGFYARTLHASMEGEWDYDLELKRTPSNPVRPGWLRAIMAGHDEVAAGLDIDCPVLMLVSARSDFSRKWEEGLRAADIVLDADRLAARAHNLGWHVTLVRLEGGMHDLVLSPEPVRTRFFDEVGRWERAYLP